MRDRKSSGKSKRFLVREYVLVVEEDEDEELLTLEEAEALRDRMVDNAEAWGNDSVFRIFDVEVEVKNENNRRR